MGTLHRLLTDEAVGTTNRSLGLSILLLLSLLAIGGVGTVDAQSGGDCVVAGESIQTAINAASPNETICVDSGTYSEQLTISTENVTLRAATGETPVLDGSGSLDRGIEVDTASNVSIEGFEIRGYDAAVAVLDSENVTIESNTIVDNEFALRDGDTASHGLVVANNTIERNTVRGLYIAGSDDVRITDNHLAENGASAFGSAYGIYIDDESGGRSATVDGNTIDDHDIGVYIRTPDAVVQDNDITAYGTTGIDLRDADDSVVENNTLTGEGIGIESNGVSRPTIRNNSIGGSGTDIRLDDTTSAVVADNALTTGIELAGVSGSPATFDHTMSGNTVDGDPVVYFNGADNPAIPADAAQILGYNSTNVDIDGVSFEGVAAGIQIAASPDIVVSNATITNTTGAGIRLWDSDGAVVEDNVVTEAVQGPSTTDAAIRLYGSSGVNVTDNEITDSGARAVRLEASPDAVVGNNTLVDNVRGLYLNGVSRAELRNNTVTGTTHGGSADALDGAVLIIDSPDAELTGNNVSNNLGSGIYDNRGLDSEGATMTDNLVTDNGENGIYWTGSGEVTFDNNTVTANGGRGILGPDDATVTDNTVDDNVGTGIEVSHDSVVENNSVSRNGNHGIYVNARSTVRSNTVSDNDGAGIYLRYYDEQLIENNDLSGHDADLVIFETQAVTVRDNTFETGVRLIASSNPYSTLEEDLTTHAFDNNTVAGKALYYANDTDSPTIPSDPGQVIVVNSTTVDVSDLSFDGVTAPIQLAFVDGVVRNNTITDATGSALTKGTVTLWASDTTVVEDNEITGSTDDGLRVVESDRVELRNNTITGSTESGIILEFTTNTTIDGGVISSSASHGIEVDRSDGLTIENVTVDSNGADGIRLETLFGGEGATVRNSTITDNAEAGVGVFEDPQDTVIGYNDIENNGVGVDYEDGGGFGVPALNATYNWWGDASGPSGGITDPSTGATADGSGDAVTEDVRFDPFLGGGPEVTGATLNRTELTTGESVTVTATVENNGGEDGSITAALAVDGGDVEQKTTTVAAGDTTTLDFVYTFDTAGSYALSVDGESAGSVTVSEPADPSPAPASFAVSGVTANASVVAGEVVTATATVENTGGQEATKAVDLVANGTTVSTTTITLAADETETVSLSWTTDDADVGDVTLEIRSEDDTGSTTVTVDPISITAAISLDGRATVPDPESGGTAELARDSATADVTVEADLAVESVGLVISSRETTYVTRASASYDSGNTWTAAVPFDSLPDDGRYAVSAIAVDERGNTAASGEKILLVDREAPSLSVSLENVTADNATVVVESDEPLVVGPTTMAADVVADDGTTSPATVTRDPGNSTPTRIVGTLEIDGAGEYIVTATSIDRAGNEATAEASSAVYPDFRLSNGTIELSESGTAIEFVLNETAGPAVASAELAASLSENANNPDLDPNQTGVGFLSADLDSEFDGYLEGGEVENATISIAVNESVLGDTALESVEIQYYNETTDRWEPVDTDSYTAGGTPFVTANVTQFSTYGAVVVDTDAPTITDLSPADGADLDADEDVTITADYADSQSGINLSSVSIAVNGTDVTTSDQTAITSTGLEHTLSITAGTEYTVSVDIGDRAGNVGDDETTFSGVEPDSESSGPTRSSRSSSSDDEPETEEQPSNASDNDPLADDEPTTTNEPPTDDPSAENDPSADDSSTDSRSDTDAGAEPPSTDDSTPGFGFGIGAVALLATGGLLARRR